MKKPKDIFLLGDCRDILADVASNYFSACVTDPPYNYEFIGRQWDSTEINRRLNNVRQSKTLVKNIPYGSGLAGGVRNDRWYAKVRQNILDYEEWCSGWGAEVFRTLRPGAFALVFNSTRTVAHVQSGLEKVGFYARDILVYRRHAGIPKGLNASKKLKAQGDEEHLHWQGWHSCLRNEWEAVCVLQKPLVKNYVSTLNEYGVGLFRAEGRESGFQSNIIEGIKRRKEDNIESHCTVKPIELMERLVELVVPSSKSHVVLDPFAGTGTTCVAARNLGNSYVGIEIDKSYGETALTRLASAAQPVQADRGRRDTPFPEQEATPSNPRLF
jgi:site-specific DNA-methyltransferase (adenine-specific)